MTDTPETGVGDPMDLPVPTQPHPYLARMARFTDGAEHDDRRRELMAALPPVSGLEDAAAQLARRVVDTWRGVHGLVDATPVAKAVPVAVLADALGCDATVVAAVAALCDDGTVGEVLPDLARASLLYQCRDATAALVLAALAEGVSVEPAAPVHRTRRAGPAGEVWVSLADAPFGRGAHGCPGRDHAVALARGVVRAFDGYRVLERGPDEPRPNMTLPATLLMVER